MSAASVNYSVFLLITTERLFGNTGRIVIFSLEFEISGVGVQRISLRTMVQTVQR